LIAWAKNQDETKYRPHTGPLCILGRGIIGAIGAIELHAKATSSTPIMPEQCSHKHSLYYIIQSARISRLLSFKLFEY